MIYHPPLTEAQTKDRMARVRECIEAGQSFGQCAKTIGVHKSSLRDWLTKKDRHDLILLLRENPYPCHTPVKETRRRVLFFREARAMNRTLKEVASVLGLSLGRASKLRKEIGDLDLAWEDFREVA